MYALVYDLHVYVQWKGEAEAEAEAKGRESVLLLYMSSVDRMTDWALRRVIVDADAG